MKPEYHLKKMVPILLEGLAVGCLYGLALICMIRIIVEYL